MNSAVPLLVVCGDAVRSVVELPAVRLKLTEKLPCGARLLKLSTMLTVAADVDPPSEMIGFGENAQAMLAGPPPVNTRFAVAELTRLPSLNVTLQPGVAKLDLKTNRA